jgi:hypothetical protein
MCKYFLTTISILFLKLQYTTQSEAWTPCGNAKPANHNECIKFSDANNVCCFVNSEETTQCVTFEKTSLYLNQWGIFGNGIGQNYTIDCGGSTYFQTPDFFGTPYCNYNKTIDYRIISEQECLNGGTPAQKCCYIGADYNKGGPFKDHFVQTCLATSGNFANSSLALTIFKNSTTYLKCSDGNTVETFNVVTSSAFYINLSILAYLCVSIILF